MMKKAIFLPLVVILSGHIVNAQVNLQTGSAEYSIPLYSYSDPVNRLSTGISLMYTAGNGLKVSELPSSVGAGWALNCGGFVQRIQHGEPDDQRSTGVVSQNYPLALNNTQDVTDFWNWVYAYYPDGYLYTPISGTTSMNDIGAYTPLFPTINFPYKPITGAQADVEQDLFMFNFNGRSGYFVIGKKDQNNVNPIRTLYDSKLRINKIDGDLNNTNNIRTTISEFQITDENGIKYIFRDAELTQVCVYDKQEWYRNSDGGLDPNGIINCYQATRANTKNAFTKNKWYLSEIVNTLTNAKITLQYEDVNIDMQGDKSSFKSVSNGQTQFNVIVGRLKYTAKRIKKLILSPRESVDFVYAPASRIDVPGDNALQNININYDNVTKSKWEFQQGYFVKNEIKSPTYNFTSEDKVWSRLCLQQLKKTGTNNISEPPYTFSYFMGNESDLPNSAIPPLFSFYQDIWGYYNGHRYDFNTPSEPINGNLLPKSVFMKPIDDVLLYAEGYKAPSFEARNGILKTAVNSLGGALIFSYEPVYFDINSYTGGGGVRVNQTTFFDGNDHSKDIITEYKYVKPDESTTSGWGPNNFIFQNSTILRIHKKCGSQKYPGVNFKDLVSNFQGNFNSPANNTFSDALGLTIGNAVMSIVFSAIVSNLIELFQDDWKEYPEVEYSSDLFTAHNLIPFQYSRVEVINRLGAGNTGKTVYEFTSPADVSSNPLYAVDIPSLPSPYSSRQRFAYWLYGQPERISVFDKDSKYVKVTENTYSPVKYTLTGNEFVSRKWMPTKKVFGCDFFAADLLSTYGFISQESYSPICGRIDLMTTKEYIYNNGNPQQSTFTENDYQYSPDNYMSNKVTVYNSKGEMVETYTYYPPDYTLAGAIQMMKDNNIINTPVSSQTLITKSGSQKYLLSGAVSEFGVAGNGDIKVIQMHTFRSDNPVISTSVPFSGSQLIPNTAFYKSSGTITYNTLGIPVQVNSDNGKVSTLYDYANKMPVATVANADAGDIAYTSFEADGNGSWSFDGTKVAEELSVTGKKCFKFPSTGALISRVINSSKKYALSFWVKGNVPYIYGSGISLQKTFANTATGYTYYEYDVTNGSIINIDNTNNGSAGQPYAISSIDELRLYPKEARMSTVTYDPLIGRTAECDPNGRITYFEYDDLGRLQFIRDQNRNVTKMYEYNYKH